MKFAFTAEMITAAKSYLESFSKGRRKQGEILMRKGAVNTPELIEETHIYVLIRDHQEFDVDLRYSSDGWSGMCTCAVTCDCHHVYAAMRTVMDELEPETPSGEESQEFTNVFEEKLGRKLFKKEQKFFRAIERIYSECRQLDTVYEYFLNPFFGKAENQFWIPVRHKLWPESPKDLWETWLYIAGFLKKQGQPWPPFLEQITEEKTIERLVSDWKRKEQIQHWRERLSSLATAPATLPPLRTDLRVVLEADGACLEFREEAHEEWKVLKKTRFEQMAKSFDIVFANNDSVLLWAAFRRGMPEHGKLSYKETKSLPALHEFFRNPLLSDRVLTAKREPFHRSPEALQWKLTSPGRSDGDYRMALALPDGSEPPPPLFGMEGEPPLYITEDTIFEAPHFSKLGIHPERPNIIPAPAFESPGGVALLDQLKLPLPERLASRVRRVKAILVIEGAVSTSYYGNENLVLKFRGNWGDAAQVEVFTEHGWMRVGDTLPPAKENIVRYDRSALITVTELIQGIGAGYDLHERAWTRRINKGFPEQFSQWLLSLPPDVELRLSPELASLKEKPVSATFNLEVESVGVDWFDVRTILRTDDLELSAEELQALLTANGSWVRFGPKGWKRLAAEWSESDEKQLADLGLNSAELSGEPQRMHALQLASESAKRLMPAEQAEEIRRRVDELRTRVNPPVPEKISAELRPYQVEGFHFLAYLSTNRFGGILADDMGLGKTLQTLTWMAWLREQPDFDASPSLVVCPKSVMPNWKAEAERFLPGLRVSLLERGDSDQIEEKLKGCDLLVVNYTQLRLLAEQFAQQKWHAVILDEAQAIKNPDSQTAKAAYALTASNRLALSGTPVENRLLDLWSILAFAMPGVLGPRARFAKLYDKAGDPLARRRLSARVRPFLLRRTKNQVARDLPPRVEEDIVCELEGKQETLYKAELKRARQMLLKIQTSKELDKQRMNILTSLLRLRQICCHPVLVDGKAAKAESAKLDALLEMLDSLMDEGHKVLVFSQFLGALEIIRAALVERGWKHFLLTGDTENRGELVQEFQQSEGAAVFLLSLKAGGAGLNLTAASYVVLFDPWWNPAVENQAIDRTHRIGQTQQVIAYRFLVKGSIEEKIRGLQKAKSALAEDVLGEEAFARGLTLDDFRFLLGE